MASKAARDRFKRELEEDLRASQADYEAGRFRGPFETAEELIKALNSPWDGKRPGTDAKVKKTR